MTKSERRQSAATAENDVASMNSGAKKARAHWWRVLSEEVVVAVEMRVVCSGGSLVADGSSGQQWFSRSSSDVRHVCSGEARDLRGCSLALKANVDDDASRERILNVAAGRVWEIYQEEQG